MAPSKRKAPSTETPTPSLHPLKRQRQHGELQERLSQTLDRLTTESRDVRIQATKDLLQLISTEATSSNGLISTVITRLVRGLSSGRKEARFGFFVALTEVLVCLYGPNGEQDTIQGSPDLDFAFKANEKAADQEGGMVRQVCGLSPLQHVYAYRSRRNEIMPLDKSPSLRHSQNPGCYW